MSPGTLCGVQPRCLVNVLETALYHDRGDREEIERFYGEVLGLPLIAGWADGVVFRVGSGVLLLFDRDLLTQRDEPVAAHGTRGPGHACLRAGDGDYERWREHLQGAGVELVHDARWGDSARSFYFKDPAGNLLEIADCDFWPQPA